MPTLPRSEAELRDYLEHQVGPIPPRHWRVVKRNRWAGNVLDPESGKGERVELLAQLVADLRDMRSPEPVEPSRRRAEVAARPRPDPRFAALARITALEAAERREVLAFRASHLPGGLLPAGEVQSQVERWEAQDRAACGPPPHVLAVEAGGLPPQLRPWRHLEHYIRPGESLALAVERAEEAGDQRALAAYRRDRRRTFEPVRLAGIVTSYGSLDLCYPKAGGLGVARVARGGVLAELRELCRALKSECGWSEPAAVAFVLSGSAPRPSPGSASCSWSPQPLGHRVTLEVHPSMSQREVAALYARMRARVTWWPRRGLSERQAALAVFVAEVNDGRSWAEAAAAWNARRPAAAYADWRTFRRDAMRAFERVHGGAYRLKWLGRSGRPPTRARERGERSDGAAQGSARPAHKLHTIGGRRKRRSR